MYSQLIYFIIALLLFTMQQPGHRPTLPLPETVAATLATFLLYTLICYLAFRRLRQPPRHQNVEAFLSIRYHRTLDRLALFSLGILAFYVYVLNIKFYLQVIPAFNQSLTLEGMTGLGLYLLHLTIIWVWSHPVHQKISRSDMPLRSFIKGHLAFNSAILIPWFLIALASDLVNLFGPRAFLNSDLGQVVFFGLLLALFVILAPWLVVRLWGCKPLSMASARNELENFCRHYRFRVGDFLLWPLFGGETLTAGVIGILPRWRYILITRGLLGVLSPEELKAVVAHEMGHVRRLHLPLFFLFFACFALLVYSFHSPFILLLLKLTLVFHLLDAATNFPDFFSLLYSAAILLLLLFYFRYCFGYFLRNSERQADLYALNLIGHPFTLISSLQKIAFFGGQSKDQPNWHHYSIGQRIAFLAKSYENPALSRQHHRKLYVSAALFVILVIALSTASLHFTASRTARHWQQQFQIQALQQELSRTADNPQLYAIYGSLLLEQGHYQKARSMLLKALRLVPDNADIINNLAWLYATSPPPYFHPHKALLLSQRAASLDASPYILDTLAQAYYVNGRYRDAVQTIKRALHAKPADVHYFAKQKQKFEQALKAQREQEGGQ